jgi:hypothetical protein
MRNRPPKVKPSKASARGPQSASSAGAKRKQRRPRPKSLVAGRTGPHARFPKGASSTNKPLAQPAQKPVRRKSLARGKKQAESPGGDRRVKPRTSSRENVARLRKPVVSVFGRRLTPHPKPRT